VHPQKQHTSLHYRKITFFHNDIYGRPHTALCHKAYQKHNQVKLYVNFNPHKHHSNMQGTTKYVPPVYVKVSQLIGSLNTSIICTHYVAQCREQVTPEFGITLMMDDWNRWKFSTFNCRATAHLYGAHYNRATETTFTVRGDRNSCNVPSGRFNGQFRSRHGLQTEGVIHNNLAGYAHHLFF